MTSHSYPIAYSIIVLPFSVVRWDGFRKGYASPVAELSTKALWGLSGVFDVTLYFLTRPTVLRFAGPGPDGEAPGLQQEGASMTSETGDTLDGGDTGNDQRFVEA